MFLQRLKEIMESPTYEKLVSRTSKEDMALALHELLSDHEPEIYYGRGGREQRYCRTCLTSSEEYEPEYAEIAACNVMDIMEEFIL